MNTLYIKGYRIILMILSGVVVYGLGMAIWGKKAVYDYSPLILLIGIFVYVNVISLL